MLHVNTYVLRYSGERGGLRLARGHVGPIPPLSTAWQLNQIPPTNSPAGNSVAAGPDSSDRATRHLTVSYLQASFWRRINCSFNYKNLFMADFFLIEKWAVSLKYVKHSVNDWHFVNFFWITSKIAAFTLFRKECERWGIEFFADSIVVTCS